MSRKNIGFIAIAVGIIVALVGVLADTLSLGNDPDSFGWQQTSLLVVGLIIAAGGAFVALRSGSEASA